MSALAADLARALDASLLLEAAGTVPDRWQAEVLRSSAPRLLLNCCRQSGKSTVAGALAVHAAVYQPPALVLLLSPSLRQSQELFKKAVDVYRLAGKPVAPETENKLTLELENGSRIVSLPGREQTTRGFSGVRLLIIDEAARVDDPSYYALRPTLAVSGGRLVALSTPWGKQGWFFEAWQGEEPWERYEVPATMCPRITPAFLAEERRTLGALWHGQEYLCEFRERVDQVFSHADIARAVTLATTPLFGEG